MTGVIIDLSACRENDNRLEVDVENSPARGLCVLAVTYDELDCDKPPAEGHGFELIGLLFIFDPLCGDTKPIIRDSRPIKTITVDQPVAKETSHRSGLCNSMHPAKVLQDSPAPGSQRTTLD